MSDLMLGLVIGKLGGGGQEINTIPVDFVSSSGKGVEDVVTVPIPEGRPHCVVYLIHSASVSSGAPSYYPELLVDGESKGRFYETAGGSVTSQSPVLVQVRRITNNSSGNPSHTGTVYYWPAE